jgi:hypothetical protein
MVEISTVSPKNERMEVDGEEYVEMGKMGQAIEGILEADEERIDLSVNSFWLRGLIRFNCV